MTEHKFALEAIKLALRSIDIETAKSKDDLILRQVAFKGAIEVLCNYNLEDDDQHVYDKVKDLTNKFHEILKQ